MGGPIKERRGTCSRMILINDSDDDYHVLPRKCGKSDDRNDNVSCFLLLEVFFNMFTYLIVVGYFSHFKCFKSI